MASELTTYSSRFPVAPETLRILVNRYLTPVSVTLLIASLFTTGLISFELFSLSVTSWDLAIIVLVINAALLLAIHDWRQMRIARPVLIVASAFGVWVLIEAIRSPQEIRGLTMAVLLLRNYVMIFALLVVLRFAMPVQTLNRLFFGVGILMAAPAIVLFLPKAHIIDARRPAGSIIILIDELQVPRLTGFANDPNFYVLASLMAMFFVFAFRPTKSNAWIWAGVAVIIAAFILAFSRSGYAALFAGGAAALLVGMLQIDNVRRRRIVVTLAAMTAVSFVTFAGISQLELNRGRSVVELTTLRFDRIASSPRFVLWRNLLDATETPNVSSANDVLPTATVAPESVNPIVPVVTQPTATAVSEGGNPVQPAATEPAATAVSGTENPVQPAATEPAATAVSGTENPLDPVVMEPTATVAPVTENPIDPVITEPTATVVSGIENPIDAAFTGEGLAEVDTVDAIPTDPSPHTFWRRVFGNGLRSNEVRLGTYSHSSYLDATEEMGIVGTVLLGIIGLMIVLSLGRSSITDPAYLPWVAAMAVILVMMSSLSMLFMPYFWLTAAIAIHVSHARSIEKQELIAQNSKLEEARPATQG